jgi:hypothetical protein
MKYANANRKLLPPPKRAPKPGKITPKIKRAKNRRTEKTTASVIPSAALA